MYLGYILNGLPVILPLLLPIWAFLFIVGRRRKRSFLRSLALYLFSGYCVSLFYFTILWYYPDITLFPQYRFLNVTPFVWVRETYDMGFRRMMEQLALNIGMYLPYGFLLPIVFRRPRTFRFHIGIVFLTTLSIESLQYIIGRSADIDDIIMNMSGGILGYLFFSAADDLLQKKQWWRSCNFPETLP